MRGRWRSFELMYEYIGRNLDRAFFCRGGCGYSDGLGARFYFYFFPHHISVPSASLIHVSGSSPFPCLVAQSLGMPGANTRWPR